MPSQAAAARIEPMTGEHAGAAPSDHQAGIEEANATFENRRAGLESLLRPDRVPGRAGARRAAANPALMIVTRV